MDWIEVIIWVVGFIIYWIAWFTGHTGRMSGYNNSGYLGLMDIDNSYYNYDPLADIRQTYEEQLKIYYQHNQPKQYLINKNCEARLVKISERKMYFYCKERHRTKTAGRYFEVKGNLEHVATMWAIIDMEFNSYTRFQDVKDLYYKLNQGFETRGGLRYYNEPLFNKLPAPEPNKSAQNEKCRMYIETLDNGDKVLYCSEIWGEEKFDKQRAFVIQADKHVLYGILAEFTKEKDKMLDYLQLLYRYGTRPGCKFKELIQEEENRGKNQGVNQSGEIQEKNLVTMQKIKKEPEPTKYIHVDFGVNDEGVNKGVNNGVNKRVNDGKNENNERTSDAESEPKLTEEAQVTNIEKYDERNLDL